MAKKELQIEDDIIDLTELIESGNSGDRRAASAYAKAAKMQAPQDDDFESILSQETGGEARSDSDPDETLDMSGMGGIDNLLESLDMPPQPRDDAAAAKAAEDDLDSALDDLLGPEPASAPKEDAAGDLDAMLSDLPADEPGESGKQAHVQAAGDMRDLDADLDDLLSSFDEPAPKTQPAAQDKAEEISADLDDILNDVAPPPPPDEVMEEEIRDSPVPQPDPEPVPSEEEDIITRIDLPEMAPDPALEEEAAEPEPAMPEPEAPDFADSAAPEPSAQEPENGSSQSHMPALEMEAPATLQSMPAAVWSPETVASLCRSLSGIHDSATQQALQGFARELGEQSAHIEDFAAQMEQLAKRVMACESRLSAARVKIANLEKSMESAAALDDLLREGTPLHAGFMGLIAAAVSTALQNFSLEAPRPDPDVLKRLDSLTVRVAETSERVADLEKRVETGESQAAGGDTDDMGKLINGLENTDARIGALEKKLAKLNDDIGEKLEKTAAATAAKVLQEEIARLIQEGNGI